MRQHLTLFLLLFFVTVGTRAFAQVGGECPAGTPGAYLCELAGCTYCNLDGIEDFTTPPSPSPTLPQTIDNCLTGAPPITIGNPRFYRFIAGTSFVNFSIKTLKCQSGTTLEAAVMSTCDHPYKAISCGQLDPMNPTLLVSPLVVGQSYLLVVDGVDNAQCTYHISVLDGSTMAPQLGNMDSIQGPKKVCPKATASYTIPPVQYALNYIWTAPPGTKINGGSNTANIPAAGDGGSTVNIQFGSFGGQVCVTASNVCDTPKTTCIQIVNEPLPVTVLPEMTLCYEELPYVWDVSPNQGILAPGKYTLKSPPMPSYLGCDSIVQQTITALPRKFKNLPPKFLCKDECYYVGGFEYCDSGTYQEILTADNGCDSTVSFVLVKIPVNAEAQVVDTLTCKKTSVVLRGDGSSTGNTIFYRWINSSGTVISNADTAVVTAPGAYSLIVTNFGGGGLACEDTATVVVAANTTPPFANAGPDRVIDCDEPLIQLHGTGSTGSQYTYNWIKLIDGNIVSGGNTLTPTVNAPGTYRLVVTDNTNGCTAGNNAKVTADVLPPSVSAVGGSYSCSVASVTIQSTTNASNPTFLWSGPNGFTSTEQNPVVSASGDYTVVVTDNVSGCTNAAIATVVANTDQPGAEATGGVLTCSISSVILSGSTQTANPVYAWTGPNGFTSAEANPTVTAAGNYLLTVTGGNGCTSTATASVALDNTAPGAALAVSGNLNCNNAMVTITASSTDPSPALTHDWTLPDNSTVSTGDNPALSANAPGNYLVVVTNPENGCTSSADITVIQHPVVSAQISAVTDVLCFGAETGSATVSVSGGDGSYTYLWSNDATTPAISGVAAGSYSVTITDGEQCTASASVTINEPAQLVANATATPESVNGAADGTASANPSGGTGPYTYLWSNNETTPTISDLAPGLYTVVVTDGNGCTVSETVQVIAGSCGLSATFSTVSPNCFGEANGSATITIQGGNAPFTYLWSSSGTDATETGLAAGTYTVTVTDVNGCTVSGEAAVVDPPALTITLTEVINTQCANETSGSASVIAIGGTGALSISWSNSQTGPTATNLSAGTYTAVVTDTKGCTSSVDAVVQSVDTEAPVIVNASVTAPLGNTGSVTLSVQSLGIDVSDNCGVATVSFVPASFNCTQLGPHDVAVTATDGAGNATVETITVTVVDNLSPTLECPDNVVRCFGDDVVEYPAPVAMDNCLGIGGSFDMPSGLPSGSTFPPGVTTNTFTYTDANGNVGTCSFTVNILDALTIALDTIVHDIDNQHIGSISIDVNGSLAPYTYVWLFNGDTLPVTTEDLTNIGAGNYQVFIVDAAGCAAASEAFTVKSLVDTKEPDWASGLLIVPNPTSGKLSVIFPQQINNEVHLTVHDMTGRMIRQQTSEAPKRVDFDLSALPAGMYKMEIVVNDQFIVRKIVVSR